MSTLPVAELLKLTNGIPWEVCCIAMMGIKEGLDVPLDSVNCELQRWQEAGAIPNDHSVVLQWLTRTFCDRCGRRVADQDIFLSSHGFGSCPCTLPLTRLVN